MASLRRVVAVLATLLSITRGMSNRRVPPLALDVQARDSEHTHGLLDKRQSVNPRLLYPAHNLSVPIDHFHNDTRYAPHSNGTFPLRYWFDAQFYTPGGPVIVLSAGETSGVGRLPFLQKGIVYQLAKATGGLGVILEHRYYGTSIPTDDFSTANLRWLTTEQALADTAYFARNVKFPGLEAVDFSPETTPWIAYGGSYAGAFVAFLRVAYPDVFWGAISSSGVPEAIWDYWQYFTAAATYGPPECIETTRKLTHVVDNILTGKANDDPLARRLKDVFGLGNVTWNNDFAQALNGGIYGLQSYNWDLAMGSDGFWEYCRNVSSDAVLFPATEGKRAEARALLVEGGYGAEVEALTNRFLNYVGYVNLTAVAPCTRAQDACFGTNDGFFGTPYTKDDVAQDWRLWPYQYCTEWGYLQTGSGVPADQLPLISRLIDVEFSTIICREAFNITEPADVDGRINDRYGGFGIRRDRLAFVDGEWDPWRQAGVQAIGLQPPRESTPSEPVLLIPRAVHHWDENGAFDNETRPGVYPPFVVSDAQEKMAEFVKGWLAEWVRH